MKDEWKMCNGTIYVYNAEDWTNMCEQRLGLQECQKKHIWFRVCEHDRLNSIAQCTVCIGFSADLGCAYLPISRCWREGNCSTSWTNFATFDCDLDCYLYSSSLTHRNSYTTYGWPLTSDARFLNRPCDCVKHKKNKQHDRSVPQIDLASMYMCETSRRCFERFIG